MQNYFDFFDFLFFFRQLINWEFLSRPVAQFLAMPLHCWDEMSAPRRAVYVFWSATQSLQKPKVKIQNHRKIEETFSFQKAYIYVHTDGQRRANLIVVYWGTRKNQIIPQVRKCSSKSKTLLSEPILDLMKINYEILNGLCQNSTVWLGCWAILEGISICATLLTLRAEKKIWQISYMVAAADANVVCFLPKKWLIRLNSLWLLHSPNRLILTKNKNRFIFYGYFQFMTAIVWNLFFVIRLLSLQ